MKTPLLVGLVATLALFGGGCSSFRKDGRVVNTRQPGPAVGTGVGVATGAVAGNVAGAVVGAGEGFAAASSSAFDSDRRVVRSWQTVTTSDGRTIRVPVEIEVDEYGRPYGQSQADAGGATDKNWQTK